MSYENLFTSSRQETVSPHATELAEVIPLHQASRQESLRDARIDAVVHTLEQQLLDHGYDTDMVASVHDFATLLHDQGESSDTVIAQLTATFEAYLEVPITNDDLGDIVDAHQPDIYVYINDDAHLTPPRRPSLSIVKD